MANNTNVIVITGNLVKGIELKKFPGSGTNYCMVSIASDKWYWDKQKEDFGKNTTWTTVRMKGDLAEKAKSKLDKGHKVTFTGSLGSYQKVDPESNYKYNLSVVEADSFESHSMPNRGDSIPEEPAPGCVDDFSDYPEAQ